MIKTVGIVAEYNPFHNGHLALVNKAKVKGYTHCVSVVSGNFTQRCRPAITEKRVRAQAAIASGVDLIIELPVAYATATAETFAYGGISLLKATGVVDGIIFGSELGSPQPLIEIEKVLESKEFSTILTDYLEKGITFAAARSQAVGDILGKDYELMLQQPNNILGIEYIKAINALDWQVGIETIGRINVGHHDTKAVGEYASASYIRSLSTDWSSIQPLVPKQALKAYQQAYNNKLYPTEYKKLEQGIISYLRRLSPEEIALAPDVSEGIENRIYNSVKTATTLKELEDNIKTKRYTLSRVRRIILTTFLGITQESFSLPYIRVLGFNKKGEELLSLMKKKAELPFDTSLSRLCQQSLEAKKIGELETFATDQFTLTLPEIKPRDYDLETQGVFML